MRGSFAIGRVGGIEIRVDITFLIALPLIAFSFSRQFASMNEMAATAGIPGERVVGSPLLWGALVALALFGSVLVHELAHARVAIRRGGKVRDITLLMIGGVSNVTEPPRSPRDEAVMALAGPVASLALAALFYVLHLLLGATELFSLRFALFYLAGLNLALGLFNLLPAFPMDGGRVLRGVLAARVGPVRATRIAATLGKVFAALFVVWGFLSANFFLVLIAFFVWAGAEAESAQVIAQSVLGGVRVRDLIQPAPAPIDPAATLAEAAARMLGEHRVALVAGRGPDVLGVVSLEDLAAVPPEERSTVLVQDVMRPAPSVPPSANVWDALRLMSDRRLPILPVVDAEAGRLVGVLQHDDVVRALRLYQLERGRAPTARRRLVAHRP